jgi:hypothetical protein
LNLLSKNNEIKTYRIIIVPLVLYGYETWSIIFREEEKVRVTKNRVLRKIFGQKKQEIRGEWREIHTEELNKLYASPIVIRFIK